MCKLYGGIPPNNKPCTTYGITLANIKDSVVSEAGATQAEAFISIPVKKKEMRLYHSPF